MSKKKQFIILKNPAFNHEIQNKSGEYSSVFCLITRNTSRFWLIKNRRETAKRGQKKGRIDGSLVQFHKKEKSER